MPCASRRDAFRSALLGGALAFQRSLRAAQSKTGMPGLYPGRVIAVQNPNSIVGDRYQPAAIETMMHKGMLELTGAPGWPDAWRALFQPGDVVGVKVSPVGGPKLCSDPLVLHQILDGLQQAGVKLRDVVIFSRYREEITSTGIDKWLPKEVRWTGASEAYNDVQLDMDGYDPDHYMEMSLIKPGENVNDAHYRRSYIAKVVTKQVNKFINLPVLKHHQSAGVTIALKNMSHGMSNNVNRSHLTPTLNACGVFIPSVVNLPIIREKAVLHICDGVKASFHGGPSGKTRYIWEHKTMYFATDPVALDKTGLAAIDAQRKAKGLPSIALSKPDKDSTFLNCQVEHIEIAGMLGLGVFDDAKMDVKRFSVV